MPVELPQNIVDEAGNPVRVGAVILVDEDGEAATIEGGGGGSTAGLATEETLGQVLLTLQQPVEELAPRARTRGRLDHLIIGTGGTVTASGADTDELVAAVSGERIRVYKGWIQTDIACVIQFKSGAGAGTAISGAISLAAGGQYVIHPDDDPEFETVAGDRLAITKSTAATLTGELHYLTEADA